MKLEKTAASKRKKLAGLKTKLGDLEKVKLPSAMKKIGQAYEEGGERQADPNVTLADDEVAVLSSMILDLKVEITKLVQELKSKT